MMTTSQPLVSVVVTTKNEARNIRLCLDSIRRQTWTNIEMIVVDNASTDETKVIATEFTELVFDKGPERSAQRNYGLLEVAHGEFGMFIDADMVLSPTTIETCVDVVVKTGAVAVHVDEIVLGRGALAAVRRFERSFYSGTIVDGVRFFRISNFREVGGFDESLPPGPEDWDLDKKFKLIGKLALVRTGRSVETWGLDDFVGQRGAQRQPDYAGLFHNEDEQSIRAYLRKKAYYSPSMDSYVNKWKGDPDVARQLGFRYRYFGVFMEHGRWRSVLRHPLRFAGVFCIRVAVGAVFLVSSRT